MIRTLHRYGFRSGEWARCKAYVADAADGPCWLVEFADGTTDWWRVDDPAGMYEFSPMSERVQRARQAAGLAVAIDYSGPDESVECAYPPCTRRLRRSDLDGPQWCSKEHRSASWTFLDELPSPMNLEYRGGPLFGRSPFKKCARSGHKFGPLRGVAPTWRQCRRCNYVQYERPARRHELSFFIGPCAEEERDALMYAIMDLPEFAAVGGGAVGAREASDDE